MGTIGDFPCAIRSWDQNYEGKPRVPPMDMPTPRGVLELFDDHIKFVPENSDNVDWNQGGDAFVFYEQQLDIDDYTRVYPETSEINIGEYTYHIEDGFDKLLRYFDERYPKLITHDYTDHYLKKLKKG